MEENKHIIIHFSAPQMFMGLKWRQICRRKETQSFASCKRLKQNLIHGYRSNKTAVEYSSSLFACPFLISVLNSRVIWYLCYNMTFFLCDFWKLIEDNPYQRQWTEIHQLENLIPCVTKAYLLPKKKEKENLVFIKSRSDSNADVFQFVCNYSPPCSLFVFFDSPRSALGYERTCWK